MNPPNREEIKKRRRNLASVLVVLSPFFVFDWIEFFGRLYAPNAVGHFSCSLLPFAKISLLFLPYQFAAFVQSQCATPQLHEPTLSIMFYMLKVAIAVAVAVIMTTWIYVIPVWLLPSSLKAKRSEAFTRINKGIEKRGGIIGDIKSIGPIVAILLLFCFFTFADQHVTHFGITPMDKFIEDIMCLTVFAATLLFVGYFSSWTVCGLKQIKFSTKP